MKPHRFRFRSTALFGTSLRCGAPVFVGFTVFISGLSNSPAAIFGAGPAPSGSSAPAGGGAASPTAPPVATDGSRANVTALLNRTNQAVGAALALQNAARAAAAANTQNAGANPNQPGQTLPNVPNGLVPGGLQIAPGAGTDPTKWIGADLPTQALTAGKTEVTIKQTTQQALLSWQTLNVGKETTLKFDQSAGGQNTAKWIAFNKINDPTTSPTQILGSIKADGQVYIINPNGIIFGGSSQVNARNLTVSSLPINDNLISRGLLNNPDAQFLFSGLDLPAGTNGTPAFVAVKPASGKFGDVIVLAGATLTSPSDSTKTGGRITLVGANVRNDGTISTPDGQTILASGLQVGFDGHSSADPSLRGLDVFVGAVTDPTAGLYTGTTTQAGLIEAARGAITIAGRDIRQNGVLVSTTSVALNGRVDIQANYNAISNRATANARGALFLFKDTGAVSFGPSSLIRIQPEYSSKETTIGTKLALRSQINVAGKTIRMGEDSLIAAPNALVSLAAGSWFFNATSASPISTFVEKGGQIYLERKATIDVAGSIAKPVSVAQNFISVDLRSAELADSPLQRMGTLRNTKIDVDIREMGDGWIGTPLANVAGFANLIQRSIDQLSVAGGEVSISAGGSVVMQQDSSINVSGGTTSFERALVHTTMLITGGRLVDIGSASPDVIYSGIYDGTFTTTNAKFGVSETFTATIVPSGSRYEQGYTDGAAGGKLTISAPSMALDGKLLGLTEIGEKQRSNPPPGSELTLSFQARDTRYPTLPYFSPTPPLVTFGHVAGLAAAAPFGVDADGNPFDLRQDRKGLVTLSPDLMLSSGFGSLTINNRDGNISVPGSVQLTAPAGGTIKMVASNITVDGSVSARGGSLSFTTHGLTSDEVNLIANSPQAGAPPVVASGRGIFKLGATGQIIAAGMVADDRASSNSVLASPLFLNGGSVNILGYSANLSSGGLIDVSGGASINARGAISYGKGGSLLIAAGREPGFSSVLGGTLTLASSMQGYSGTEAGSLNITGPAFQIGGAVSNVNVTLVDPERFASQGFGKISLGGVGIPGSLGLGAIPGLVIVKGTAVEPVVASWFGSVGEDNKFGLAPMIREETVRTPAHLSFAALGASFAGNPIVIGEVRLEDGSSIITDAGGSVSVTGQIVTIGGSIVSSGGTITIAGDSAYPIAGTALNALPTVHLTAAAYLSTAGSQVLVSDPFGRRTGMLFGGGIISVAGNIVAEAGALLDVSGASGILDLPPTLQALGALPVSVQMANRDVPVMTATNAGTITLKGAQMLFTDATLLGRAGGRSAMGGTLNISSGNFLADGTAYTTADANLIVRQTGAILPTSNASFGVAAKVVNASGNPIKEQGYFSISSMAAGGFDSLSLGGNVRFEGDVSIQLPGRLGIADGGVLYSTGKVQLAAGQIVIGQPFRAPTQQNNVQLFSSGVAGSPNILPYQFTPNSGTGSLVIQAGLVDIGNLSLDGIGSTRIDARDGDIRGNGTFQMAGDLTLQAGQIYPTTQGLFNVFVYDPAISQLGKVTILPGSLRSLPYSAGGNLSIYASQITQAGALRAPNGTIRLGWDGSGIAPINPIAGITGPAPITSLLTLAASGTTSVSLFDPVTGKATSMPYGISFDGLSWIDPAGNDITVSGAPAKTVNLAAVNLVTEEGSTVDIRGGGDLYAYRWISGNGGTKDILASSDSFAIIPGYGFNYAPFSPFNPDPSAVNLQGQAGYVNSNLSAGDQITLAASSALPAGTYTLLPARYALLPGAVLVTPKSSLPPSPAVVAPDGSSRVAGYRSNNLDPTRQGVTTISGFEIAPSAVVRKRAEYQDLLINSTLRTAAISRELPVPRLPLDSGYLSLTATTSMVLRGEVSAISASGRGGLIDINSSSDILINSTGIGSGGLVLSVDSLNQFSAESLLIGGLRSFDATGVKVVANSSSVTLDNAGTPLIGKDIILVSRESLTLGENSSIIATRDDLDLDSLTLGDPAIAGSGDGVLVRVSANASGQVFRSGVSPSVLPSLIVLGGSNLSGGSIILDSTARTNLAQSVVLDADDVALNSGKISIILENPGTLAANTGLVLGGEALASLQSSAKRLSLLSYSTIDTYGTGTVGSLSFEALSLQAAAIRGFNTSGGTVSFSAATLTLGNRANAIAQTVLTNPLSGNLTFDAGQITLNSNSILLDGFAQNTLQASGIITESEGSLDSTGNLNLVTPLLTGANASKYQIRSNGALQLTRPTTTGTDTAPPIDSGFGAALTLSGASVAINGDIALPSGKLTLHATAGDLVIGNLAAANLQVAGTQTTFVDTIRYTSGGTVSLLSDSGSVTLDTLANIDVSAPTGGGDAGLIQVKAPQGIFDLKGTISGTADSSGASGSFVLDAASVTNGSLAALDSTLNSGSFTESRDYRIRTGDVLIAGLANARNYRAAADSGSIMVTGTINASGLTGGVIDLQANGSLTLAAGSLLDASAEQFNSAGKGGSVTLEAGNQRNGLVSTSALVDLQAGSSIDLTVANKAANSEALGMFSGTLHLRTPRNASNSDLQLNAIGSSVLGASSILVEGVKLYELSGAGTITTALQNTIKSDAAAFLGSAGITTAGYSAMLARLTALQPGLDLILTPGAEIFNRSGDLVLGTTTSTATSDWDLASLRFGPRSAPGVLTLRASGDLVFYNALSDGFAAVAPNSNNGQSSLWLAPLMAANSLLPANSQSWSYRMTSGSDLSSADFGSVLPESSLVANKGSFLLGKNYGNAATYGSGANHTTETSIERAGFQVIRTGSGSISINSGRDVYLLNQFATIYTAGTLVNNPTTVFTPGDFVVPLLLSDAGFHPSQGSLLGAAQQPYFVQYSMAGGNLSIHGANDVARMTRTSTSTTGGVLIDDSSRQLPNNWLYRRGFIDPTTGASGVAGVEQGPASIQDSNASTTWWIDFSNFFEGLGTLGGGDIQVTAGRDVKNIDAAAPTNARMASGVPSASKLIELGGGDISIVAGRNIDAGVYYVERGEGQLKAGASIITNSTRSPSRGILASLTNPQVFDSKTWLATTLFVGKGGFDVQATGDLLLGPISNPFWLPQGLNNKFWYKTYFNTYAADSYVNVISLGGSVTHRAEVSLPTERASRSSLSTWLSAQQSLSTSNGAASFQPWLRTAETDTRTIDGLIDIMVPTLRSTSLSSRINLVGNLTLAPSPIGQIELIARDTISGLQPSGFVNNLGVQRWITSTVNLSDADPKSIPGVTTPYAYLQVVGPAISAQRVTGTGFLQSILSLFTETGSANGVLQDEQARHTSGNLHADDSEPVRIFARDGNIEGFSLFSPKQTRIIAGQDIGDIAFYIQNLAPTDVSVVSAGRDLVVYNENTVSRTEARRDTSSNPSAGIPTLPGDIQISGPGSLLVFAGRDLDLGFGSGNADGTGSGISSIGNARNPYLSFEGAGITVGAGISLASDLSTSSLAFDEFETRFIKTEQGEKYLAEIAPGVDYETLSSEQQAQLALEIFYLILRDTGRDFNDPESPGYRGYDNGFAAISTLFPESGSWDGSILTRSRDIRTRSGGDINILAPGGGLALASNTTGNPLTPPGIVTESGGNISIFADESINIGIGRIFTLKGGNVTIWSSTGDIAAGSSSRTVSAAPPTRVIIDPQSAAVETDLAGLATGGGIGVLASLDDVESGDVDLIAPAGVIDAGDAGIRVSGNINLAAVSIVNAGNISAGGASSGVPAASVSAPSIGTVTSAANSTAAVGSAAVNPEERKATEEATLEDTALSLIAVEVIGYGGGNAEEEEEDKEEEKAEEASSQ